MKIVYYSFRGQFSDNPRALYERLRVLQPQSTHTWLCTPATRPDFPGDVDLLEYKTAASVAALESADLVIANDCMSLDWTKSHRTTYLQTWHGTPLKRIHHDVQPARPGWLDAPDRDVARWDLLLSPNHASTERLRRAFRFAGPVVETGYPRNDLLSSPDRDRLRARARAELGIAEHQTVVLYTPTWRDHLVFDHTGPKDFELPIDLAGFTERFGADHVLLLRLHGMVSDRLEIPAGAAARDVSRHPDVRLLYLAADVMVTDYSSTMFDFAITGKPMLFLAYDLEHYRDERGFYVDLADIAPGPLLRTGEELMAALEDLDAVTAASADRYARFRETFCHLEDGAAADRVLDLVLGERLAAVG